MQLLFVVNNDLFATTVTRQFLHDHAVIVVPNLADAWEAISQETFDVALVDYDLDDGKGDTLVQRIRAAGLSVKIVAVSSHDRGNAALLSAGADVVCGKMEFGKIREVLNSFK